MSKRPSVKKQVIDRLYAMSCYGESKYQAKQEAINSARAAGSTDCKSVRVDGIYSIETMKSYRKESISFVQWASWQHGCRWLDAAKEHVKEYLEMKINRGDSAWSVQLSRAALRKLYQDCKLVNDLKLPIRHKYEIIRSRGNKAMDKKFSVEKNKDLIDFCRAAGLRRHELAQLKVENIRFEDGRFWVDVEQGKGGRPRSVPVLKEFESRVREIINGKNLGDRVIEKIPVRAVIHGYRREYANSLYKEFAEKEFNSGDKDRISMLKVSWALGHNRLDVVTRNYLG